MRYLLTSLVLLLLFSVFIQSSYAAPRTDCGKIVSPDQSIQTAINNPPANKIICVKPGTYHEMININKSGLTLTAFDPAKKPTLDGKFTLPSTTLSHSAMILISSTHITLDSIDIARSSGVGVKIYASGGQNTNNNTIKNSDISQTWNEGIFLTGEGNNSLAGTKILNNHIEYSNVDPITKSKIHKKASEGGTNGADVGSITIKYARGILNDPDKVILIEGNTMSFASDEQFMVDNNWGRSKGIIIRNNIIKNSIESPVYIHGADDIIFDRNLIIGAQITNDQPNNDISYGCIIIQALETQSGNKYRQYGYPLKDFVSENVSITNNITAGCIHSFVTTVQDIDASFKNLNIQHNTFVNIGNQLKSSLCEKSDKCHDFRLMIFEGHNYNTSMTNTTIANNIFYHAGDHKQKGSLFIYKTGNQSQPPADVTFKNNIWSKNPGNGINSQIITNPKLAGANPSTGEFSVTIANSKVSHPPTNANSYKLLASSPAINTALASSLKNDHFGALRPSGGTSDIGAHEFGGIPTTPKPQKWDLNHDNNVNVLDFSHLLFDFTSKYSFPDLSKFTPAFY